jgi:hypothetical protein
MVEVCPPRPGDIARFAYLMREPDTMEIWLSHAIGTYEVVLRSVELSTRCFVATTGGVSLAIFGVVPITAGVGSVWLLGADGINRNRLAYARACREFFPKLIAGFQVVENYIWAGYEDALRWARWLGFQVEEPRPWGAFGAPFCHAWREA